MKQRYTLAHPVLMPKTVDVYLNHRSILASLLHNAAVIRGNLLDLGCGNQPYKSLLSALPFDVTCVTQDVT